MTPGEATSPATRHRASFFAATVLVVLLDQASKHWALHALDSGPIDLVGSLRLNLVFNDGAAFSVGSGRTTWIALVALGVSGLILRLGLRADRTLWAIGLGVILGGALGNLVDRLVRRGDGPLGGHVVDFIDLQWWPVFNVADMALWLGIALLAVSAWSEAEPR